MLNNYGSEDEEIDSRFERPSETNLTEMAMASIATEEDAYPLSDNGTDGV